MIAAVDKQFFLEQGCLHVPGVLAGDSPARYQQEFDRVWKQGKPPGGTRKLLKHPLFLELIGNPILLNVQRSFFGTEPEKYAVPWEALEGATTQRLELLGMKMPLSDIHQYELPEAGLHAEEQPYE